LPRFGDAPIFDAYQNVFTDLVVEIYQEEPLTSAFNDEKDESKSKPSEAKPPVATVNTHKLVLSLQSRYFHKMLTSNLREGTGNTVRLITAYPASLKKLLLSCYEHVLEIKSDEEMIEMLYLADEYDVAQVMIALKKLFPQSYAAAGSFIPKTETLDINSSNARKYLKCSAKLGLKLEPKIFVGLTEKWWQFSPHESKYEFGSGYERHEKNCRLLLSALNFEEEQD
jgi:hypothetical protein